MKKLFILHLFFLLLTSCSSIKRTKSHQLATDPNELSEEEISRRAALEKYRRLREENWNNYVKEKSSKKEQAKKKIVIKTYAPPPDLPEPDPKEVEIQVSQMLDYHCIKDRIAENDCQELQKKIRDYCFETPLSKMVSCIKESLKNI